MASLTTALYESITYAAWCRTRVAWFKRHPSKQTGLIFHSDRGSQYASQDFRDVLTEYGITASMSRRGNCWVLTPTEN